MLPVLEKALRIFGRREQEIKTCEELGELQSAIFKSLKDKPDQDNLVEEIADVLICLEYVKRNHCITDEMIEWAKSKKLVRLEERLSNWED